MAKFLALLKARQEQFVNFKRKPFQFSECIKIGCGTRESLDLIFSLKNLIIIKS